MLKIFYCINKRAPRARILYAWRAPPPETCQHQHTHGLKTVLQRRLHGLLVEAALESRREEAEAEQGEEAGEAEGTRDTAGAAAGVQ